MSNAKAIATVTTALAQLARTAVQTEINGADVVTSRPDPNATPGHRAHLFLYQVSPNAALRNADLPSRDAERRIVQRPAIALELHYLLAFYGDENDLEPQRMLSAVARDLHAYPVLTSQMIELAVNSQPFLSGSNLAGAIEKVRFTFTQISLEELSKLWSVFFQTTYALSLLVQASVVLIESEDTPQAALPVRQRDLSGIPFNQPQIHKISMVDSQGLEQPNRPIEPGSRLLATGRNLRGVDTLALIDGEETPIASVEDTRLLMPPLPAQIGSNVPLRAGIHGLQVIQRLPLGQPLQPHRVVESNAAPFVLHPTISAVPATGGVTVTFNPAVGKQQRVALLLNERTNQQTPPPNAYRFEAPADNGITDPNQDETTQITFLTPGVQSGVYLVRVLVDGAESILTPDANGVYADPNVTL